MRSINRFKKNQRKKLVSDINITPFVDVLLVLLIIFMVAAPMMNGSFDINLPKGSSKPIEINDKIIVNIDNKGKIFIAELRISESELNQKLTSLTNNNLSREIFIQADKKIDYGQVMSVINKINKAGFQKVILVTDLEK